jgi:hypothetical protein
MRLTRNLRGRKLRCPACQAVLAVAADSWDVSLHRPPASAAPPEPLAAPAQSSSDLFDELPAPPDPSLAGAESLAQPAGPSAGRVPPLPRRASGPPRRRPPKWLWIAGIGSAAALVAIVVVVIALTGKPAVEAAKPAAEAAKPADAPATPPAPQVEYAASFFLPDDTQVLLKIDARAVLASKFVKDYLQKKPDGYKQLPGLNEGFEVPIADLTRYTAAAVGPQRDVVVMEFGRAMPAEQWASGRGQLSEEHIGPFTAYFDPSGRRKTGVVFPNDHVLVVGTDTELRAVLRRNHEAQFSAELSEALKQVDEKRMIAGVTGKPPESNAPLAGMPMLSGDASSGLRAGVQSAVFYVDCAEGISLLASINCKEDKSADQFHQELQKQIGMLQQLAASVQQMAPMKPLLDSLKLTREGRSVKAQLAVTAEAIAQLSGMMPGGSPMAGGVAPGSPPGTPGTAGGMPPGGMKPGMMPPGGMMPGMMPPGGMKPGMMPPGGMMPGMMPPGGMKPGMMPPGGMKPGEMPPGAPRPGGAR